MATIDYGHTIGGKGVGEGLPLRRASHLYDVEPERRYPTVIEYGYQGSQFQYDKNTFHTVPHLPITFTVSPYISNHKNDGSGNFTRMQHFTIVRGQPVMAAMKTDATIGVFVDDGGSTVTEDRTYADPSQMASNGIIIGFYKPDQWQLKDGHDAGADPDLVIDDATYQALDPTDAGAPAQDDYEEVTIDDPVPGKRFFSLPRDEQEGYRASYEGVEDTNDQIATGGVNMFAEIDKAVFGTTDYTKHVKVDANSMFFGHAEQCDGFLFPSTGGAHRTYFYNEVDAQAEVTLPVLDASQDIPRQVKPLSTTDVTADNLSEWQHSAARVANFPTIGVMHTEIEATQSHKYHHFSTGTAQTGPRSPVRSAQIRAPYFNITKLADFINQRTPLTYGGDPADDKSFNFTDQSADRSGMKVGLYGRTGEVEAIGPVNDVSYLSQRDAGYANLYYNYGAPFMVTDRKPSFRDRVKSDLFAQYTLEDAGVLDGSGAAGAGNNAFDLDADYDHNLHGQLDMRAAGLGEEVIGKLQGVDDVPSQALEELRVSRIWQNRIIGNTSRNATNEGYSRQGNSSQTGGVEQLLADAFFMAVGGANYDWASSPLPQFEGAGYDLGLILREAVLFGAVGVARFAVGTDI